MEPTCPVFQKNPLVSEPAPIDSHEEATHPESSYRKRYQSPPQGSFSCYRSGPSAPYEQCLGRLFTMAVSQAAGEATAGSVTSGLREGRGTRTPLTAIFNNRLVEHADDAAQRLLCQRIIRVQCQRLLITINRFRPLSFALVDAPQIQMRECGTLIAPGL